MLDNKKDFESRIRELEIANEALDKEAEVFFQELDMSLEEVAETLQHPNLSEETKQKIEALQRQLDEKERQARSHVRNSKETKKKFQELFDRQNYLFVR